MKTTYKTIFFLSLFIFLSCQKETKSIFKETQDQRIQNTLTEIENLLISSKYGWNGKIIAGNDPDNTADIYFKFNPNNRVISTTKDFEPLESSYRLKMISKPELIFDTHTYIHMLGNTNMQFDFDFEFEFATYSKDSINLVGRFSKSTMKLVPAEKK